MDITLFVNQVNQLLQAADESAYLEKVCDLLRLHICASVTLLNDTKEVVLELLHLDCLHRHFKTSQGMLVLYRDARDFDEAEILAVKVALSVCIVLLKSRDGQNAADKKRRMESVRSVINTLSFSELEAATHVMKALLDGSDASAGQVEGLLVAGNIADKLGFTRSIVTGALRKLEGAGFIETRSLGMKGTYIRVKDLLLVEELGKL